MFRWGKLTPKQTVRLFIESMNGRDFAQVEELLAKDFCLIDNADKELRGAAPCAALLRRVADLAPDYQLEIHMMVERGEDILITGKAHTSSKELANSSQWRARAKRGLMREWQTYSNSLAPSMIATLQGQK